MLNVGCPIAKTNAPRCYNKLFEFLDMNAIMLPCEIQKGQLPQFMDACRLMGIHYLGFIVKMPKTSSVFDCVINPPDSETILAAKEQGLNTIPGMQMLVSQMDLIFDFLFGKKITKEMQEACIDELCSFLGVK